MISSGILTLQSCGENNKTDVVASGTYRGVAEKVEHYFSNLMNCGSNKKQY